MHPGESTALWTVQDDVLHVLQVFTVPWLVPQAKLPRGTSLQDAKEMTVASPYLNPSEDCLSEIQASRTTIYPPRLQLLRACMWNISGSPRNPVSSPGLHKRVKDWLIALQAHVAATNDIVEKPLELMFQERRRRGRSGSRVSKNSNQVRRRFGFM